MIFNKLLTNPNIVINKVCTSIKREESLLLTYLNQHCFNIYCKDKDYKRFLDSMFELYQADLGMYLAIKYLRGEKISRIDATTMNENIMDELKVKKIPVVLVGGNFDQKLILEEAKKRKINLVGYKNGFFEESQVEDVMNELKNLYGKVYIIGMGVPKQELFAVKLSQIVNSKVIICVGNFLESYFGKKKRAPVFIQKMGMEWMFRLVTEPGRLWRRYLLGIPVFIFRIIKIKLKIIS